MIYGELLPYPIIIYDFEENIRFMAALTEDATISPEELSGRVHLELAFFWGEDWAHYLQEGKPLDTLKPEHANQHGRFYLASSENDAIVILSNVPGPGDRTFRIEATGIDILAQNGAPTQVIEPSFLSKIFSPVLWIFGVIVALLLTGVVIALQIRRKRSNVG